ncbi:MAG: ATP-binding response regulator [Candidatus Binatia bacterium]
MASSSDAYTILVVDDDQEVLIYLRAYLERNGHRVLTAASAEEAVKVFLANDVHLLIVDYVMPGMDGAQLVRAIRGFDPFIQIVVQTGYAAQKPPQHVLDELDIQGYHDKMDGPQKLMTWVTVCLRTYRLIRRLREREKAQAELITNVSHEFRTPVNVIHGYVSLFLDQAFGAFPLAAEAPLRAVEKTVRELAGLVENVLEHARLEAGGAEVTLGCVDIGPLSQEMERLGRLLLDKKPIALSICVDADLPVVHSDVQKLRTILRNLLSNAAKFTREGEITVTIARRGEDLEITVRDTGAGVSPAQLPALFEPFRQGDGSSTRQHGGIGIGLALSRQYARLLGGDLTVESIPGSGSTFTLRIPGVPGIASVSTRVVDGPSVRTVATHAA